MVNKSAGFLWVSWQQPGDDPRPLHSPPKDKRVLGWWVSGEGDGYFTICALIHDEPGKWKRSVVTDWPEVRTARIRFEESTMTRPGGRFVMSPWMKERMDKAGLP